MNPVFEKLIIEALRNNPQGLKRGQIQKALKANQDVPAFSESTLQRVLKKLVEQDGRVKTAGHTKGTTYFLAEKSDLEDPMFHGLTSAAKNSPTQKIFSKSSLAIISRIQGPTYLRNPVGYNRDFLLRYIPNQTIYLESDIRQKLQQAGMKAKGAYLLPAGTYAKKVLERLLIDLSFNSSRLEGNTYTLLDTERLIADGIGASEKSIQERTMILNHKEAIQFIVDSIEEITLSSFTLRNINYALMQDLLAHPTAPGEIRKIPVNIGKSVYTPCAIPQILAESLSLICEKANRIKDPFEQSFFLLVHISYLQAFEDGNKRTARLASNIPLIRENFCPNSYADIPRDAYNSAMLAVYENNELGPLIEAYLFSYQRSAKRYDVVIQAIAQPDEFRIKYRSLRKELIGNIIRAKVPDRKVEKYIEHWLQKTDLPPQDRELFIIQVKQDLNQLSEARLSGLKVTLSQFKNWLALKKTS